MTAGDHNPPLRSPLTHLIHISHISHISHTSHTSRSPLPARSQPSPNTPPLSPNVWTEPRPGFYLTRLARLTNPHHNLQRSSVLTSTSTNLTQPMAPQQPTARGIRIRNAHDAHLLFYAVVRHILSFLSHHVTHLPEPRRCPQRPHRVIGTDHLAQGRPEPVIYPSPSVESSFPFLLSSSISSRAVPTRRPPASPRAPSPTFFLACFVLYLLTNFPHSTRFLLLLPLTLFNFPSLV